MIYYVNAAAADGGDGSEARPFCTIQDAARVAIAGDTVLVAPGIYREYVNPIHGGTDDAHRIHYLSQEPLGAVITGAEPVTGWVRYQDAVWSVRIPNSMFGSYNPYTSFVQGDWYFGSDPIHTGEVYLNGKSLYEVMTLEEVLHPKRICTSWKPEDTIYTWYTGQEGDATVLYANFQDTDPNAAQVEINVRRSCFTPEAEGINYITLSGFTVRQAATPWAPPTAYQEGMIAPHWSKGWIIEDCEVSHSKCSGISLGKYLQPNNENKWFYHTLKDGTQTERDAICQAQAEGWSKETIGSHIIRRCDIHDCGQTGIVGHLGGVFSVIEDNHIHHINNKQNLAGAEIGGIKMHAAIDVVIRRNHIHHCTRGLWLDWQAQGTRVTQNLFHDNQPPAGAVINGGLAMGEDIFIEVSHGPTLVDNNLLLSVCSGKLSTQGIAFVHNLIAGSFTYVGNGTDNGSVRLNSERYTPYHMPHRTEVAGWMTILHGDARFYNNIFVQQPIRSDLMDFARSTDADRVDLCNFICGTIPYEEYPTYDVWRAQFDVPGVKRRGGRDPYYDHLPVYTGGNVYFNGARPISSETDALVDTEHDIRLQMRNENGSWRLDTDLYDHLPETDLALCDTASLGEAFEPEEAFENPDGTAIIFDCDYYGHKRAEHPIPGPFADPADGSAVLF